MRFTATFLLFILVLVGCQKPSPELESDQQILSNVDRIIEVSKKLTQEGHYEEALLNTIDAIAELKKMEQPDYLKLYRYYRNQASFAKRVKKYQMADGFADSALRYLERVDPELLDKEKHELSTKKFQAMYKRFNRDYQGSVDLTLELLEQADKIPGMYEQLKNQLGISYLELGDYTQARIHFSDILKISDLDSLDRSFYFRNLARVHFETDEQAEALSNITQAIVWLPSGESNRLYHFMAYKDAGEYHLKWLQPEKALSYFARAHKAFGHINSNPDHFEIYRQEMSAEYAIGNLTKGNELHDKYDSLLDAYQTNARLVDEKFELAMLDAKNERAQLQKENSLITKLARGFSLIIWCVGVPVILLLLVLFRVLRKKRRVKVLTAAQ